MRRNRKIVLIFISLLFLGFVVGAQLVKKYEEYAVPIEYSERVMGIPVVENTDFLQGMKKNPQGESPGIYFEGVELPFCESNNTLYLSQDFEVKEWQGTFSTNYDNGYLCMPRDSYWENKAAAIKDGHSFALWLITEQGEYYEFNLQISGMPVISIQTQRVEKQELVSAEVDPDAARYGEEVLYYGDIRLFNPGVGTEQYEILECGVEYHPKGATSLLFYDKVGYGINLLDAKGNNLNQELLGMRSDNSWKLNALVTDHSRIREKTANEIWEKIDQADEGVDTPGARLEYVELVLDNDYLGLYCLVEPIDANKLKLDKNDILYKMTAYLTPGEKDFQAAIDNQWRMISEIRMRYPKEITDYEAAWSPLRDYVRTFFVQEEEESGIQAKEVLTDLSASSKQHISNVVDMMIFSSALSSGDSYCKNTYLAADVAEDGSYVMRRIPWDLDLVFGNVYDNRAEERVRFNPDIDVFYHSPEFTPLLASNMGDIKGVLRDKWTRYRQDILSTESISQNLLDNKDYLMNTGVIHREKARWPQYEMDLDIEYLLQYQEEHMAWLDGFITSITE